MNDKGRAWLLGLLAFLVLAPGAFFDLPPGKVVVGATRILQGEIPYRDFWSMYAPGSCYLTAGLFAVFGRELVVQGLASCALWAAAAGVLYLLLLDAGAGRRVATACAVVLALARWHTGIELSAYEPAFLLALLAWRAVLARQLGRAGVLIGFAAIFKHDFAAYAAIGSAMAIAIRRENPLPLLRASLAVVVPAAILLAAVAGADAWRDLVLFPATDFSRVRGEPYPHFVPRAGPIVAWIAHPEGLAEARGALLALARYLGCFLPQVFLVAGIAILLQRGRTAPDGLVLAVALLPLYWLAAHVQQNTHVYTMAALSMIVFATAWETGVLPRWALGVAGAFHAVGVLAAPALAVAVAARALPDAQVLPDPGASLVLVPRSRYDELRPITGFVRRNVPAEEPIYVGLERHEATVISSPILYYLCDRTPAVRYHELHPGITDREAIQAEMLGWIEGRRVQCVVLWRFGWSTARQDAVHERLRRATPDGGSDTLDLWIEENFETVVASGEFEVLWRRP